MDVHEVLCRALEIQERRGYFWFNGVSRHEEPCCAGACIAAVVGAPMSGSVVDHPASLALAREFPARLSEGGRVSLSIRAMHLTEEEILAGYRRAIAKTAPEPDVSFVKVPDNLAIVIERL